MVIPEIYPKDPDMELIMPPPMEEWEHDTHVDESPEKEQK